MKIYELTSGLWFPNPYHAPENMPMAIGGDLSPERLIKAYQMGIFPWFNEEDPILWWSPNPRMVLYPDQLRVSKSMKKVLKSGQFTLKIDNAFNEVIECCQSVPRKGQEGTWITQDIINSYKNLHELGVAHSFEVYQEDQLVGGLYGVSLGKCFFGESMFSKVSNASKFAFIKLAELLEKSGFDLIDCQVYNEHLASLGAVEVDRSMFLDQLQAGLKKEFIIGSWSELLTD